VFDFFYRADNEATRQISGLGVGLAIVKAIIEMHDGKLKVDAATGNGAIFTVQLPLSGAQAQSPA